MSATTRRPGRPTIRNAEIANGICDGIASGKSLYRFLEAEGMPSYAAVCVWLREDQEFQEQYAQAREDQADFLADEILTIADGTGNVHRDRLRLDARMWIAGKLRPKKYGIKPDAPAINVAVGVNVMTDEKLADLARRKRKSIERRRAAELAEAT